MLHVLYLVHDLSDPAVRRRVMMLRAGGAKVTLAGFRRAKGVAPEFGGISPIELGSTRDGQFGQRLVAVAKAALTLGARLRGVAKPDLIIGRNLEMLALANRAKALFSGDTPIVYECLDIHRLLLRQNGIGRAMRAAERLLGRNSVLLMTSSPAFVREYFEPFRQSTRRWRCWRTRCWRSQESLPKACDWQPRRPTASPGRSAGSARCAAASRWRCLPPSRARWTAASRSCCAAVRPIPNSTISTAGGGRAACPFCRPLPQPRGSRRDLRRSAFLPGRSISSRKG